MRTSGPGGPTARQAAILAALSATLLAALGRFRPALALTLGASIAIFSALRLSDLVGRLRAARSAEEAPAAGFDWKFGLKAVGWYLLTGLGLYGAIRLFPDEVAWVAAGLSVVVVVLTTQAIVEFRRSGMSP